MNASGAVRGCPPRIRTSRMIFRGRMRQRENCKFGTPNVALRGFAIANIDFTEMGLGPLFYCKSCHYAYFPFIIKIHVFGN
jgi:hypothetical protein